MLFCLNNVPQHQLPCLSYLILVISYFTFISETQLLPAHSNKILLWSIKLFNLYEVIWFTIKCIHFIFLYDCLNKEKITIKRKIDILDSISQLFYNSSNQLNQFCLQHSTVSILYSTNPTHFLSTDSNSLKIWQNMCIIVFTLELVDNRRQICNGIARVDTAREAEMSLLLWCPATHSQQCNTKQQQRKRYFVSLSLSWVPSNWVNA